jgi:hypothetical protein
MASVARESKPVEPAGPEGWSDYWDLYTWEVSDPDERAALEAAEVERIRDVLDVPQPSAGEAIWAQLIIEGSLPAISGGSPEPFEPSPEDWADYHAWSEDLDDRRRQVSDVELSMMSAGLAVG